MCCSRITSPGSRLRSACPGWTVQRLLRHVGRVLPTRCTAPHGAGLPTR
ncbi:MAG: maleylpyruvate isomerase N-terminal domain-containing protein [Pseudonocardiaceae bacterium]